MGKERKKMYLTTRKQVKGMSKVRSNPMIKKYKRKCIECGKMFTTNHQSHKRCKKCYNNWSNRVKKKRRKKDYR